MRNAIQASALGIFFLLALAPPLYLFLDILFVNGEFSLEHYRTVLSDQRQWDLLGHSLLVGGLTSLLTFLLGVPAGYILARIRVPGKALFRLLYLVPVMLPTYIMGITWTEHFDLYGLHGTVLLLGICYWPLVALFAEKGFRQVGRAVEDAARVSRGPGSVFFSVTLPLALPTILAGELFVFILAIGDFGIPDFLSFSSMKSYQVYTLEIFNLWSVLDNTGEAVAVALPLVIIAAAALWGIDRLHERGGRVTLGSGFQARAERPAGAATLPIMIFLGTILGASTVLPLTTLACWLNQAGGATEIAAVLREGIASAGQDTLNSIWAAVMASGLMVLVGFFVAYRIERGGGKLGRLLSFVSLLPLAFPPVMLAVADIRIWNHPDNPLSDLVYGTQAELVMIYFARFIPIAILSIRACLRNMDPVLEEASRMSGRGELATLGRITVPLIWGGIWAAFFLAYILCMRELDSVALISAGNDTLPQRIYSQIHTSRDVGIGALCWILVFTLLVPPLIHRLLVKGRINPL